MKNVHSLVCSFIVAFLLIASTAASAHKPPPKQNNLVLLDTGEALQVAFSADCNVPQGDDDASLVPVQERSISFDFKVEGRTVGGSKKVEIKTIELLAYSWGLIDVPTNLGQLLELSIENVSGQGVCQILSVSRIKDSSGNTVAGGFNNGGLANNMWASVVNH